MNPDKIKKWKLHGTIGILLVIIFWFLNWHLTGLRTHLAFFPLWLGFILTVDAIVFYRKESSLLKRNINYFIILFLISIPGWWLFELFNWRMENWFYQGREYFTNFQFFLLASLSFSTVMPAVFECAELITTFHWFKIKSENKTLLKKPTLIKIFVLGLIIMILILLLPKYFYYLIWIALFFIIDPINFWLGNKSLLENFYSKNWRSFISLALGCLICAFFWEMWNFHSYPKWIYNLPMVNFLHVFEMPLLGYIGYVPFSLELFALYQIIVGFVNPKMKNYLEV